MEESDGNGTRGFDEARGECCCNRGRNLYTDEQKETSGGCIDPKTLAALLSSITSTRYQLDALDVEKVG